MMFYGPGMGLWGYLLMTLSVVIFFGVLLVGVAALLRWGRLPQPGTGQPAHRTAEQILADRFARGEIDEEEYRRRLDALRSDAPSGHQL